MQANVFNLYCKKMYCFYELETSREEFEPKRNLSCDSAEYIFSVVIRIHHDSII